MSEDFLPLALLHPQLNWWLRSRIEHVRCVSPSRTVCERSHSFAFRIAYWMASQDTLLSFVFWVPLSLIGSGESLSSLTASSICSIFMLHKFTTERFAAWRTFYLRNSCCDNRGWHTGSVCSVFGSLSESPNFPGTSPTAVHWISLSKIFASTCSCQLSLQSQQIGIGWGYVIGCHVKPWFHVVSRCAETSVDQCLRVR